MSTSIGKVILFGSGEIAPSGVKVHRKILRSLPSRSNIAIMETPAGFQPNSKEVAGEIASVFRKSLGEFINKISVIPARKRGTGFSPDNEKLIEPLLFSDYIFMGPGSPTYTVDQLENSPAWRRIRERWKKGAILCFSSAGALASGRFTLPVYEIYKAGADLYWKKGLDLYSELNISLTIITHWNNSEGGKKLDTRYCYMGEDRMSMLLKKLPEKTVLLGIDEHTAAVFDFSKNLLYITGKGRVTVIHPSSRMILEKERAFEISALFKGRIIQTAVPQNYTAARGSQKDTRGNVPVKNLPPEIQQVLYIRETAKLRHDFKTADSIRNEVEKKGYRITDSGSGQKVYKIN